MQAVHVSNDDYTDCELKLTHCNTVEDWPDTSPDTKRGSVDHGEINMINSTNSSRQDDKEATETVSDPNTQPGLPPRQTTSNHGRSNHPCINICRICDPETDKVPWTPNSAFLLDGNQVMVDELSGRLAIGVNEALAKMHSIRESFWPE